MNILAINIGNTNVHIGMYVNDEIKKYTVKIESEDFLTQFVNTIDSLPLMVAKTEVRMSSVNPVYTNQIKTIVESSGFKTIHIIEHEDAWQVNFSQYQKGKLGIDRMLVCEAAYKRKELPAIVFDFGTATTMNVIDEKGVFLGGAIFPGIYMGVCALTEKTAQLPPVLFDKEKPNLLGLSTVEAIQSAALYGNAAMIEGMIVQVEQELKQSVTPYITGGAASIIQPFINYEVIYEKELLLEGIFSLSL